MKTSWTLAAALAQVLALAWMAGHREWIARTGRIIHLRTAPLDPRDVMRGDYVRLAYEISNVPRRLWQGGLVPNSSTNQPLRRDTKLYAVLREGEGGLADLVSLSDQLPDGGLFIRGRLRQYTAGGVEVRYGIEAFFMEQGKAYALEQGRLREGIQIPLEMQNALSLGGTAVLKGFRWSPLGIGLDLDMIDERPQPDPTQARRRRVTAARLRLLNASSNTLAIVDSPAAFGLVSDPSWGDESWQWVRAGETPTLPEPAPIVVLKPGESLTHRIDFNNPRWHVVRKGAGPAEPAKPIWETEPNWSIRFRLVYQPPNAAACASLPQARLIWHGLLPSRAFSPQGGLD